jgi:hypothetical protein
MESPHRATPFFHAQHQAQAKSCKKKQPFNKNISNATGQKMNAFSEYQAVYAERGIATIPCGLAKQPLVSRPQKFGRKASAEIVPKFSDAPAIGYYAGRRNGITVLDVDTTDESVLADALDRHGDTPIIIRSASGKFHAPYRHNGEARKIRPWDGLPIDLLGAGLCIAPPSVVAKGAYEIIEGQLDDLDRLPIMRGLDEQLYADSVGPRPQMRQGDGRNRHLWERLMREAHSVDDYAQLLDRAETLNAEFGEPMQHAEVARIAVSAWGYTERGVNRFGQHGAWFPTDEANDLIKNEPDAFLLLALLRANQKGDATFMVANGIAETFGWKRERLAAARKRLLNLGYFKQVRAASSKHGPALYRWLPRNKARERTKRSEVYVEYRCAKWRTLEFAARRVVSSGRAATTSRRRIGTPPGVSRLAINQVQCPATAGPVRSFRA